MRVFHLTADFPRCLHKCRDSGNQVYLRASVGRVTPARSYLANARGEIAKHCLRTPGQILDDSHKSVENLFKFSLYNNIVILNIFITIGFSCI